jgi:hypothetical protein
MPLVLSDKAQELLLDMPPYLSDNPLVQSVINSQANEFQRIDDAAAAIRNAMFPSQASDVSILNGAYVVPILSMWETILGLPVAPVGITTADRVAKVVAHIRKRNASSGADWVATLTAALGSFSWSHQEGPGAYQVTISIPYISGSYSGAQVLALAKQITPAHLNLTVRYSQGFLVGISQVGIDGI